MVAAGVSLRDRLRIAGVLAYAHMRLGRGARAFGWLPSGDDPPRLIRLRSGVSVMARRRDAVPFYEQFGLEAYGVGVPVPVRTVVDLGANVGFAAVALAARYQGARIVCVEPDAESFALLERNLALNGVDAVALRAAVAGASGRRFSVSAGSAPASNRVVAAADGPVEGVTVAELLARAQVGEVDLRKVDIEGAEAEVFADAASWAPRVGAVIAELHEPFGVADADRLLGAFGFARVPLPSGVRFRDVVLWAKDPKAGSTPGLAAGSSTGSSAPAASG